MDEQEKNEDILPGISKEQKVGLFLLFVFAFLAVGLGALQMRNTIYGPFALTDSAPNINTDEVNTVEAQQMRDTDHDGLNDFDELYVYSTSMYLADSDSDGLTDKQEVDKGSNPLCPEGSQCAGLASDSAEISSSSTLSLLGVDTSEDFGEAPIDLNTAMKDPAQIKQMLLGAGVSADVLKDVSDEELLAAINELMAVTTTSTDNADALKALNNLNYSATSSANVTGNSTKK